MNGHGDSDCITGNNDEVLLSTSKLPSNIKNKIVYLRSCECGNTLAPGLIKNNAKACIAYTRKFIFYSKNDYVTRVKDDPLARLFLEPSNDVVIDLIKGHSVQEAHTQSLQKMYKNFRYMISSAATFEERSTAQFLWSNIKSQIVLGDFKARV